MYACRCRGIHSPDVRSELYMNRITLMLTMLMMIPAVSGAQIFKCIEDEVTVFSDTPCVEGDEAFVPLDRLSIVESDAEALSSLAEQNREFIQQRLDRISAQRQAAFEAMRSSEVAVVFDHPRPVISSFPLIDQRGFPRRSNDKSRAPDRAPAAPDREERFSALSGRFPGTRRR